MRAGRLFFLVNQFETIILKPETTCCTLVLMWPKKKPLSTQWVDRVTINCLCY